MKIVYFLMMLALSGCAAMPINMAGGYAGQLGSLSAQQANMNQSRSNNLANYYQSYNPLTWMSQAQNILNPLQQIGAGVGQGLAW